MSEVQEKQAAYHTTPAQDDPDEKGFIYCKEIGWAFREALAELPTLSPSGAFISRSEVERWARRLAKKMGVEV